VAVDRSRAGSLRAYLSVFTHSFTSLLAYSSAVWVNLLAMAAGFGFTLLVWRYALPQGPAQAPFFAYLALAFAANFSLGVAFERYIGERIREGLIATDLLKPVDYSWFFFCQASSDMVFQGCFGLVVLGIAYAGLGSALLPASGLALAASVLSFGLAFLVQFHLGFLFMQMIFATHSNYGPFTLRMLMHMTFSGIFAPIDVFPGWLGALAGWLPFRHVIYTPCAIFLGRLQGAQVGEALLSQAAWAVVLMLVSRLSFNLIRRHLTIQGG
jgi:ABC-type uncharacterized transport system permease subunit